MNQYLPFGLKRPNFLDGIYRALAIIKSDVGPEVVLGVGPDIRSPGFNSPRVHIRRVVDRTVILVYNINIKCQVLSRGHLETKKISLWEIFCKKKEAPPHFLTLVREKLNHTDPTLFPE